MLKLNFLLAIRRLTKNKQYYLINILGFSVGICASILMFSYVRYELNYDKFHEHYENIYRLEREVTGSNTSEQWENAPYPLAAKLVADIPGIKHAANLFKTKNYFYLDNGAFFLEDNGLYADNSVFDIFTFHFLEGSAAAALKEPMSVVISKRLAEKFFPGQSAMGKNVSVDRRFNCVVRGVIENYPLDSHLQIDYLISFGSYKTIRDFDPAQDWGASISSIYVLLQDGQSAGAANGKVKNLLTQYRSKNEDNLQESLYLRPLSEMYLQSGSVRGGIGKKSSIIMIYVFLGVVAFTLLISSLNYVNLATAYAAGRSLEVGIKKILGSKRSVLIQQFLLESGTIMVLSFFIAVVLALLALPFFNQVVNKSLEFSFAKDLPFFGLFFLFSLAVGLTSGIYPAFYLSSLKTSSVLNSSKGATRSKGRLRRVLVTFQLVISIALVFASVILARQLDFLLNKPIGFTKENLLRTRIKTTGESDSDRLKTLQKELATYPHIQQVSIDHTAPFYGGDEVAVDWEGGSPQDKIMVRLHRVDYNFLETYGIKLVEGRNFSETFATDAQQACLINESALKTFGWKSALGKRLHDNQYKVIGVVKDFNDYSLFKPIKPMMLVMGQVRESSEPLISVRVSANNRKEARAFVNGFFGKNFPNEPVDFEFLDENFDRGFMDSIASVSKTFSLFTILSILLAGLGLYSLVAFSTTMQGKMIAVRKVMGASTASLYWLLAREYLILYGIAVLIGLSLAYYGMGKLLMVFPAHIDIKATYLLLALGINLLVVLLTISSQIMKATRANPINALSEPQ